MILTTVTSIGILCSKCGEVEFKTLSVFDPSRFNKENTCSSCGAALMTLVKLEHGRYRIEYPCIYCGESHRVFIKRGAIWGQKLMALDCQQNALSVGYIGPQLKVMNACQDIKKTFIQLASELVTDTEQDAEFDNFFVVYAVMEKIGKMAEHHQLACSCGNRDLSVEILTDRIKIICGCCEAICVIYTDNKEILCILDEIGSIFLEERVTTFFNEIYHSQHLVKNK